MALPATDSFTGTTGTQLTAYSASWTLVLQNFDIQTNAVCTDGAAWEWALARWNADAFNDDQYAELDIVEVGGAYQYIGPAVRVSETDNGYIYADAGNERVLYKLVGGTATSLGSSTSAAATVAFRIEASGTTITPIKDGVTDSGIGAKTDGSLSSGSAGIGGMTEDPRATTMRGDNWEGGNLGVSTLTISKTESLGISASPTLDGIPNISKSESLGVAASPTLAMDALITSVAESLGLSATATPAMQILASLSESLGLSAATTTAMADLAVSKSEGLGIADSLTAALSDLVASLSDGLGISDAASLAIDLAASVSDGLSFAEQITAALDAIGISAGETLQLGEEIALTVLDAGTLALSVADSLTIVDSPLASMLVLMIVAESLTLSDAASVSMAEAPADLGIAITDENPAYWVYGPVITGG